MRCIPIIILVLFHISLFGQVDTVDQKKLVLTGDFRFRIEQDWNSINQNGERRDDRSRLRYRFRFGANYAIDKQSSFGGRIRSGNINDQQGPHVTLGGNQGEFELVSIGLEKLYYQFKHKNLTAWIGKNSIPLIKLNELFWNDNVFPEGVAFKYKSILKNYNVLNTVSINAGHFIIQSRGKSFLDDSFLQVLQLGVNIKDRVKVFPALYHFKRIGNFPDNQETFELDYSIFHFGSQIVFNKKQKIKLGVEFYNNLQDYSNNDFIASTLRDEKNWICFECTIWRYEKARRLAFLSCLRQYSTVRNCRLLCSK